MPHTPLKIFLVLCCVFVGLLFSCKKHYPENRGIHLSKPENRILGKYYITEYSVNGVDSIPLLNSIFQRDATTIQFEIAYDDHYYSLLETTFNAGFGSVEFTNKKTELDVIYRSGSTPPPNFYNIFLENGSIWKILKLYKKKDKPTLKLKREYNGKTYVIQFN